MHRGIEPPHVAYEVAKHAARRGDFEVVRGLLIVHRAFFEHLKKHDLLYELGVLCSRRRGFVDFNPSFEHILPNRQYHGTRLLRTQQYADIVLQHYEFGEMNSRNDEPSLIQYHPRTFEIMKLEWHCKGKLNRSFDKPAYVDLKYSQASWHRMGALHREGDMPANVSKFQITWLKAGVVYKRDNSKPSSYRFEYRSTHTWLETEWYEGGTRLGKLGVRLDPSDDYVFSRTMYYKDSRVCFATRGYKIPFPGYCELEDVATAHRCLKRLKIK